MTNTEKKQDLVELLDHLNEGQIDMTRDLLIMLTNGYITKQHLIDMCYKDEPITIDTAIPIDYVRAIEDVLPTFKTMFNCYNYTSGHGHGQMENLSETLLLKLIDTFK